MKWIAYSVGFVLLLLAGCTGRDEALGKPESGKAEAGIVGTTNGSRIEEVPGVATQQTSSHASMTKDELEEFLEARYGPVTAMPSIWSGSREWGAGEFRYSLADGREIVVEGLMDDERGYYVDPEFDLSTLPTP